MSPNPLKLNKVWRICNKIRTLLSKFTIDIEQKFSSCESEKISTSKFIAIISTLHPQFELSSDEEKDLVEFFSSDGITINLKNFLEVLELDADKDNKNAEFVTGLEWEDPMHINHLNPFEHRHVNLILTKIAHSCRLRDIELEPYFQDYEEMSRNKGTITISHFRRVLNFLGITLGVKEFRLLVKKFLKHNYTVNFCAFLESIKSIVKWFHENYHQCSPECYPGSLIICDFHRLPRPEFEDTAKHLGIAKDCHPCLHQAKRDVKFEELMLRIKKHILDNCVRSREFFEPFDNLRRGFVTKNQFIRALEGLGISGVGRLYIAPDDMQKVMKEYEDPMDPGRVNWWKFCDEIDEVFIIKNLHKQPYKIVECPPSAVKKLNRPGTANWECIDRTLKQLAQETLFKLRRLIQSRQIFIEQFFRDFDPHNNKHVTRCQMRRVFSSNSIILSDKEIDALMVRYGNDLGFSYMKFLKDVNETIFCEAKHEKILKLLKLINVEHPAPCTQPEITIVEVLAKIKGEIVRKRINFESFVRNGEIGGNRMLPVEEFRRNFSAAGIILENCELDILCNSLKFCNDPHYVDQELFISLMNEAFYTTKLEKDSQARTYQFIPTHDGLLNFLNYEERCTISNVLQKLSKFNDNISNLNSFFEDYEGKSGDITKENLIRALTVCGLIELVTEHEIEVLFKCFTIFRGRCKRFDYKNFLFVIKEIAAM